tara:strand:- start:88 stop:714 length:627 start_codon:yes stop_codon:yes gene_type:complete
MPQITFHHNHANHCWIILSGWGILAEHVIPPVDDSNMLYISHYDPFTLHHLIPELLTTYAITSYCVLGVSLGGLWLSLHQNLFPDSAKNCYLGIRKYYKKSHLLPILTSLKTNKVQCLDQFYQQCCATKSQYLELRKAHRLFTFDPAILLNGLQFLEQYAFHVEQSCPNYSFFHGQLDRISPVKELSWVSNEKLTIYNRVGHLFSPSL